MTTSDNRRPVSPGSFRIIAENMASRDSSNSSRNNQDDGNGPSSYHPHRRRPSGGGNNNGGTSTPTSTTSSTTSVTFNPPTLTCSPPSSSRMHPSYKVVLSFRFVILTIAAASLFAFAVGHVCRKVLLRHVVVQTATKIFENDNVDVDAQQEPPYPLQELPSSPYQREMNLPQPILPAGKRMPHTQYTEKQLHTSYTATSDTVLLSRQPSSVCMDAACEASGDAPPTTHHHPHHHLHDHQVPTASIVRSVEIDARDGEILANASPPALAGVLEEQQKDEEGVHEPSGQHLLVDMEHVDASFLNSERRLANAMIEMVQDSGLTMLSYHCHTLIPTGVSCVAVLLESHVSFHTWPVEGVITLDVFTCGPNPLRPLLNTIKRLFGIPRSDDEPVNTRWIFKNRGFPVEDDDDEDNNSRASTKNPEMDIDMAQFFMGWMEYDMKEEVATVDTPFQRIEIFDAINTRFRTLEQYRESITGDVTSSYEAQHPELFRPDRIVYLDGVVQSRRYGDSAYHESLVHPAMFAHEEPKRVAIIGGGEGATLREILKHRTVETVTMVEIDGDMVDTSRKYLPEWSDCSNIVGSAPSCFDDPRTELIITDAIAWFVNRFGHDAASIDPKDKYDVIIMDALDPSPGIVDFSDTLYKNEDLVEALYNALTEDGVLISQVGESDFPDDPAKEMQRSGVLSQAFIPMLEDAGFEKIKGYEDFHGGFLGVWDYLIAFKDSYASEFWYDNEASIELRIQKRILPTLSGDSPLRYFDGAAMQSFAYPSRNMETTFCRAEKNKAFCEGGHGFDPDRYNAPITAFEVRTSDLEGAGRGIYFKEDVPQDGYIAIDEAAHSMLVFPSTVHVVKSMNPVDTRWKVFDNYLFGYGFSNDFFGEPAFMVDRGIMTFINHGCNGTNNINEVYSVNEMTADSSTMAPDIYDSYLESYVFNPYIDRNYIRMFYSAFANRDIKAGEELLDNYLAYLHDGNWEWGILNYRNMCMKSGLGVVTAYEHDQKDGIVY